MLLLEQSCAQASFFPQAKCYIWASGSVHLCHCCISLFSHIRCSRNHNHLYFETRMRSVFHLFLPGFILNGRVKASFLGDLCSQKGIHVTTLDYHAENNIEHLIWGNVSLHWMPVSATLFYWPKYFTCLSH